MNHEPHIDPLLARLLPKAPTSRAPDRLRADIASATSRRRQRPSWLTSLKEPPMRYRSQVVVGSPTLRLAAVLAVTMALMLAIAGAVIAGASPQPSPDPALSTPPTWVTGRIAFAPSCTWLPVVFDGDVRRTRGGECNPQTWTTSDPRLTGKASWRWSADEYRTGEGTYEFTTIGAYLRNDGGGWACTSIVLRVGEAASAVTEGSADHTLTCVGDGGYAGLSAILVAGAPPSGGTGVVGLIVAGDFPPVPEPPAVE